MNKFVVKFYVVLGCIALAPVCYGQEVTIRSDQLDTAFRNATTLYVAQGQVSVENMQKAFLMKWLTEEYRINPLKNPLRLKEEFDRIRSEYAKQTGLELGMRLPEEGLASKVAATAALKKIASEIPGVGLGLDALDTVNSIGRVSLDRGDSLLRMGFAIQAADTDLIKSAEALDQLCAKNRVAADAAERILGVTRSHSAVELYEGTALYRDNPRLQSLMSRTNAQGALVISVGELRALFQAELASVNGSSSNLLKAIGTLTANQGSLLQYMTNIDQQLRNQQENAQRAAAHQKVVEAGMSSVYILSTLVGFSDPKLGHDMQVVGSSAIQIADAIGKFTAEDALQNVVLSGNILGAAMNVVGLFGSTGPSPDQLILQELGVIKQMLGQIRTEMHDRFDRVDRSLNTIYETLNNRFDQIDLKLGVLQGDVTEIQQALYGVQVDLYRIEQGVYGFLDATSRRDLAEEFNLVLDYSKKYGELLPSAEFVTAENKFHTWATINASDEASSGSVSRSYSDSAVYAELTGRPLEANLNWLSQFVATKFGPLGVPNFASGRLANPHVWSVAANGYMETAVQAPLKFRLPGLVSRLEEIHSVGAAINQAAVRVTLGGSTANRALWGAVLDYYNSKGLAFKQAVRDRERQFLISLSDNPSIQAELLKLDLWGGPRQSLNLGSVRAPAAVNAGGNNHGAGMDIALPSGWQSAMPSCASLGEFLGVNRLRFEYSNFDLQDLEWADWCLDFGHDEVYVGKINITLTGFMGTNVIWRQRYKTPANGFYTYYFWPQTRYYNYYCYTLPPYLTGGDSYAESSWLQTGWTWDRLLGLGWQDFAPTNSIKDVFVSGSTAVDGDVVAAGTAAYEHEVAQGLRDLQRREYQYVMDGLSQAGSSLQQSATELSGAKALVEAFIGLGFSQSLERDDILRSTMAGTERIVDGDVARELCSLGIVRTYEAGEPQKVDIGAKLDERIAGLRTWITNRLNGIEASGLGEELGVVTLTLERIEAFQNAQVQPTPRPYLYISGAQPNVWFGVAAEPNVRFYLESSADAASWTGTTNVLVNGGTCVEPRGPSQRFFRVLSH